MPPPRIAFIITDLHLGGSPLMLRDLAIGLARSTNPFHITIISLKPLPLANPNVPTIPEYLRAAGIHVHSLNLASPLTAPRALLKLARLLHHLRPQIVYSLLIHANLLTTLALPLLATTAPRPKFIQSIHTLQPNPAWHWTIQGIISQYADAIAVPSQQILDRIARFGNFKNGIVIPNGIDIARFVNALPMASAALPWPSEARVVGYVGRFDPVKNLSLLVQAFAVLCERADLRSVRHTVFARIERDLQPAGPALHIHAAARGGGVHLALVGYGPDEARLRALSTSLHIAPFVHFCGPTTTPERWYKAFTVMCLPSSVEGFGLTLVEAMAAGIPVVALNTPVVAAIVREGVDGTLVRPNSSPELLAVALHDVMAEVEIIHSVPKPRPPARLARLEEIFSMTQMVARHEKLFNNLLPPPDSLRYHD